MIRFLKCFTVYLVIIGLSACGRIPPIEEMTTLEFSKGGYNDDSHYVYIDASDEDKSIKYGLSKLGHGSLDIKEVTVNELDEGQKLKFIPLSDEKWDELLGELVQLKMEKWKDDYDDLSVLDGIQWGITIDYPDNQSVRISGSNDYPKNWDDFINLLEKYIGEKL
ncbi:hypothetical protein J8TS2_34240 [Lederbergia ruris]|uniref:Lipoprotein n=1 Tax=Lederbergia ruris TaxID=217495 RepID=A0ABQ4KMF1_9BACI|nr:hypothetical protein [Lederbergia ruris]GIN59105.1 hypothetical protein J8TS2_34240 [Lederbergia ruris]